MKMLTCLSGRNRIVLSKPINRYKKTTVLAFAISYLLFAMTPVTSFAHKEPCVLTGNTTEAIMAFNACKADAQAAESSGHSKNKIRHTLENEINRLRTENSILRKQLNDVRGVLFELVQKITTN